MGDSRLLRGGGWCLGVALVAAVMACAVVEAAVIKDELDLQRMFFGHSASIPPLCFHKLAQCKLNCLSCDACYTDYVACGLDAYETSEASTHQPSTHEPSSPELSTHEPSSPELSTHEPSTHEPSTTEEEPTDTPQPHTPTSSFILDEEDAASPRAPSQTGQDTNTHPI
ncbi:hypothetical protein O3P69_011449 [Scylla paramamosain]|uniref:Uncharacterized protein n=1 Tax=Scylla paramamosain TaxID=85552 RepID=A0AAW0T810_SCYPA